MSAHPLADNPPRLRVAVFLLIAMAASTFTAAILSVLAVFVVEEFALTRAELGLVVAVNTIFAGLISPVAGKVVDRIGGGAGLQTLLMFAAGSYLLTAIAPAFWILFVAAALGGISQALANPATNKVIAYRYAPDRRADITGIKQSGVQFAIFFGGILLPTMAQWLGWRWAFGFVAVASVVAAVWLQVARGGTSSGRGDQEVKSTSPSKGSVPWLSVYGFLLGLSGSSLFFLPLFAEEELGQSVQVGGFALALVGITAVVGRVVWARFAVRGGRYRFTLAVIAVVAVAGSLSLSIAGSSIVFLWLGAILMGAGASSWNSVGMLAVIDGAHETATGAASGWVLLGFLLGLGIGPPIFGQTYDTTGSYVAMWMAAAALAAIALVLMMAWREAGRSAAPDIAGH